MNKRWLLGLVAALVIYLGLGLLFGLQDLGSTLRRLPAGWWLVAPLAALLGHGLLFQRWQLYLSQLGHPLAWRPSARIYSAGLALIAAPGRSGEALRGLWLQRRHGVPLKVGVSITLAERLCDLASALLVLSWGIGQRVWPAMVVGLLVLAAGSWTLTHPRLIRGLERRLEGLPLHGRWPGVRHLLREALLTISHVRSLMRVKPLLIGTALASLCWMVEALVLQGIYEGLGSELSLTHTAVIRTATALGGVVSLLPAGLGTSEATAIGLAMAYGAGRPQALAATLVLRVATLALPCLVGILSLLRQPDLRGAGAAGQTGTTL
ncbi:MAG: lysylphosphatidylglycerol synthase transmembrane domain-containing protein [Cyanobacteriota bacterium]|nr:lysylphosphatidylglycerol synthase transmembrane domain-containing protein [Cyanobacteriota bacterium]